MKITTFLNRNRLAYPACIDCEYCDGCVITNAGTEDNTRLTENDTITSYVCTNPARCGTGVQRIYVNNPPACPCQHKITWTEANRLALIEANTKLNAANSRLNMENKILQNKNNAKDKRIKELRDAAGNILSIYLYALVNSYEAARKISGITAEIDAEIKAEIDAEIKTKLGTRKGTKVKTDTQINTQTDTQTKEPAPSPAQTKETNQ